MQVRRRVFYSGRIQGVGFRFTSQHTARGFQVTGWVKNLADGRVELLVEGESAEIEGFLTQLSESMGGNIHSTNVFEEPASGEFDQFRIA